MQQEAQETPLETTETIEDAAKVVLADPSPVVETIPLAEAVARVAAAKKETRREIQSIAELCLLAGIPGKAAEFIGQGKTEAEVRQLLITQKAQQQSPEIFSTLNPDNPTATLTAAHNPLLAAVKHLTRKE